MRMYKLSLMFTFENVVRLAITPFSHIYAYKHIYTYVRIYTDVCVHIIYIYIYIQKQAIYTDMADTSFFIISTVLGVVCNDCIWLGKE